MTARWLPVLMYGVLPGAICGGLVGAYHHERSVAYDSLRWGRSQSAPWGVGPGLVLGALAGAVAFAAVRRLWPGLPAPWIAALTVGCVAAVGLVLSASRVD
jgi:hypothetical protein